MPNPADSAATLGVSLQNVLGVLKEVRGKQRVTSQDPETTFNALEKYSRNLTEMAKAGKARSGHRQGRGDHGASSRYCRAGRKTIPS